jgi:hypothetical protein
MAPCMALQVSGKSVEKMRLRALTCGN